LSSLAALKLSSVVAVLLVYGLTPIITCVAMELKMSARPRFDLGAVNKSRMREAATFSAPVVLTTLAYSVWIGSDVVLLQQLRGPEDVADYGAAKLLALGIPLLASGVSQVLQPTLARLRGNRATPHMLMALGAVGICSAAAAAVMVLASRPLIHFTFGAQFARAHTALFILAPAMAVHALFIVLQAAWVALERPKFTTLAMTAAILVTVPAQLVLIPKAGIAGAASGLAAGAIAQTAGLGLATIGLLRRDGAWR
jgi:O-antigen/teichoic acid export membrane protein